jgi:nucleotide-binding universal stress UspA family protein
MKILLPIDDSTCSEAATQAVIAQFPSGSDVHVVHVDEWPKGLPTSLTFAEGPSAARNILATHDEIRRRGRDLLAAAGRQLTAARFRATSELRQGDPRREILACAERWTPDVIVLGSHGRRGLERFLLGSVAEAVLRGAECSVEIVRALRPVA